MFGLGQIGSVRSVFPILLVGIVAYLYSQSGKTPEWECPIVNTSLGRLQGLTSFSRDGREYFDFRGIPYARPPVGELRFEVRDFAHHLNLYEYHVIPVTVV
jgi:hypothetical protein